MMVSEHCTAKKVEVSTTRYNNNTTSLYYRELTMPSVCPPTPGGHMDSIALVMHPHGRTAGKLNVVSTTSSNINNYNIN